MEYDVLFNSKEFSKNIFRDVFSLFFDHLEFCHLIYVHKKRANVLAAHHLDLFCFCLNTRQLLILLLQHI